MADELNNQIQQMTATIGNKTNAAVTSMGLGGGNWVMRVETVPEKSYTVKRSADLASWSIVTNLNIPAGAFAVSDPVSPATPRTFYHIEPP